MHLDIKRLNKEDPPPKGCKHPAYEVMGRNDYWTIGYLHNGVWNMPIRTFKSEANALCFVLDILYYGDES